MSLGTASAVKFPFDRDFQIGILALMTQRFDFLLTAVELLQPDYFEDKVLIWFFQTMKQHYVTYREIPTIDPVLHNELKKAARLKLIKPTEFANYTDICKRLRLPLTNQQYRVQEVIHFCRRQATKRALLDAAPKLDSATDQTWDEILVNMKAALSVGNNFIDIGTNYFESIRERVRARLAGDDKRVIPTGIREVDERMNGGLKDGQLGIWLGGTGGGKSIALPHCGKRAVLDGYKVAHYSLELDELDVSERYDANWSGIPVNQLRSNGNQVIEEIEYMSNHLKVKFGMGNGLMIKAWPTGTASIQTIHNHLLQLASFNWAPDLVVVDYGDLLKPLTSYDSEYADLGAIFRDLRGLAGEYKVPLWTATQVNRAGLNVETVDIEHIGDSLKKAQIADVILAICATREERDANLLRIFGAKNRNGYPGWTVTIRSAYERMCFYDPRNPPTQNHAPASANTPPGLPTPNAKGRKSAKNQQSQT